MLSSDLFISKSIMTGRTNYWSTLLMCYLQQWGIIIRWRGCWDFKLDRLNPWMWNRDVNLFPSPLQHEPWGKTDRTLERRPSPLPFFFFFFQVIENSPELRLSWVKSFSYSIREHLTCNTFFFCLIFFCSTIRWREEIRFAEDLAAKIFRRPSKQFRKHYFYFAFL